MFHFLNNIIISTLKNSNNIDRGNKMYFRYVYTKKINYIIKTYFTVLYLIINVFVETN